MDTRTSVTLLGRLQAEPLDQAAWSEFVARYGPGIFRWCRLWNLQPADAEDVTQDVLVRLAQRLRTFAYDPSGSFRGWLKTVAYHAWSDFAARRRVLCVGGGDGRLLASLEARDDLVARLEAEFDQELLEEAKARVRLRVEAHTWEAFRLVVLEGLPGAEAAELLGMRVATVFVAAGRVRKRIQEEVRRLEGGRGADPCGG